MLRKEWDMVIFGYGIDIAEGKTVANMHAVQRDPLAQSTKTLPELPNNYSTWRHLGKFLAILLVFTYFSTCFLLYVIGFY